MVDTLDMVKVLETKSILLVQAKVHQCDNRRFGYLMQKLEADINKLEVQVVDGLF